MPPPTMRTSNVRLASASRSRVIQECAVADSIVFGRGDDRGSPQLLGTAHSRSRDYDASGRVAGVLRRSRSISFRKAASPHPPGAVRRGCRQDGARGGLRRWSGSGAVCQGRCTRDGRRSGAVGDRPRANELCATGPLRQLSRRRWRAVAIFRQLVRHRLRARCRAVHGQPGAARAGVPPRLETGRAGDLPGLQPRVLAESPLESHEGGPRARGCSGAEEVQHRRIPRAALGIPGRPYRAGASSGEIAAAWRLEGRDLQRRVRRHVQCLATIARRTLRLAPAGLLREIAMIAFAKAHAYGNDFLYVASADVHGAALDVLAREMCDRHTGIGADGLIVYERVEGNAVMRLFNADGSRAEVSGNGVRALAALLLDSDTGASAELTVWT